VPPNLTHAYLELKELKSSANGQVTAGGGGESISFQFNPKELQVDKAAKWKFDAKAGSKKAPPAQYLGPDPASMTLEMFLDASEDTAGDVSKKVKKLTDACIPTQSSKDKGKPLPKGVRFGWGSFSFEGYIEKVSAKYTLFRPDGTPIRASCTISMKELPHGAAAQNPTSGSLHALASHQVVEGDTLAGIAYQEYGDPTLWRRIAEVNAVDDPLSVSPGSTMLIPSITAATGDRS
jgi:nucleoid-associated protein YgaU